MNAPSGVIGRWGEGIARNHLVMSGIYVVRHAVFRLPCSRVVSDFYHPPAGTVYEVKTGAKPDSPFFRAQIHGYSSLLQEEMAKKVVYVNVAFRGSFGFSPGLRRAILDAGFEILSIGDSS